MPKGFIPQIRRAKSRSQSSLAHDDMPVCELSRSPAILGNLRQAGFNSESLERFSSRAGRSPRQS